MIKQQLLHLYVVNSFKNIQIKTITSKSKKMVLTRWKSVWENPAVSGEEPRVQGVRVSGHLVGLRQEHWGRRAVRVVRPPLMRMLLMVLLLVAGGGRLLLCDRGGQTGLEVRGQRRVLGAAGAAIVGAAVERLE
jgi:hypothetical protein